MADIAVDLGYTILSTTCNTVSMKLSSTIPTAAKTDGTRLFQANAGSGGHFALGAKATWKTTVCGSSRCAYSIDMLSSTFLIAIFLQQIKSERWDCITMRMMD